MTTIRRIAVPALAALATLAGTTQATAADRGLTATAGGVTMEACSEHQVLTLRLFTHGISCRAALQQANRAASGDRWCPKGWQTRKRIKLDGDNGDQADPYVTRCLRTVKGDRQAFVYHLPTG